ncbi:hypothetical protein DPMN_064980 [Dreissena polymorpha]|uniref:Uncharacterized protein n=1 Tax=Dreissena polymorpha TaxID=45954 RepID=A0A9D4HMN6_DREPO|nr:hypothetical protein DPMN_064980 [Dreissena polymorpha]
MVKKYTHNKACEDTYDSQSVYVIVITLTRQRDNLSPKRTRIRQHTPYHHQEKLDHMVRDFFREQENKESDVFHIRTNS